MMRNRACHVGVAVLWMGLAACRGVVPCSADSQCAPGAWCAVDGAGSQGTCTTDCVLPFQCGEGLTCNTRGRCVIPARGSGLELREPPDGTDLQQGGTTTVRGRVLVGVEPVRVEMLAVDALACVVSPRLEAEFLPGTRQEWRDFAFDAVPVGEGGGTITVTATSGSSQLVRTTSYRSGLACPGCPNATLDSPALSGALPGTALSVLLEGRVDPAAVTPVLFAEHVDGTRLDALLAGSGAFSRVVPLLPGRSTVGITVRTPEGGSRTCTRTVDAPGSMAGLSVHLGWDGEGADMDILLVPPDGRPSLGACRALRTQPWCRVPTGDVATAGAETIEVDALEDGTWGVLALAIPSAETGVHAVASVLRQGRPVVRAGPRTLDASRGDAWIIAVLQVEGGNIITDVRDQVTVTPPTGAPATW